MTAGLDTILVRKIGAATVELCTDTIITPGVTLKSAPFVVVNFSVAGVKSRLLLQRKCDPMSEKQMIIWTVLSEMSGEEVLRLITDWHGTCLLDDGFYNFLIDEEVIYEDD